MYDTSETSETSEQSSQPGLFNYYYDKLRGVINKPQAIDDIEVNEDIKNLIKNVKKYKETKCGPIDIEQSCKITGKDIENISKFLAHNIPKCKETNITLQDIKNGKILSKGAFGYGFSAGNTVIKIIICKNNQNREQTKKEINIHKFLTLLNMDIFTKLKGYFQREKDVSHDTYKYYSYLNNQYILQNCNFKLNYDIMCETYLLMEKGNHDLEKIVNIVNYNDDEMMNKKNISDKVNTIWKLKIVDKFEKLLTIYKTAFKMNGNVFIHSDIKTSNIVVVPSSRGFEQALPSEPDNTNVNYKLIDFGTSFISFFVCSLF